jgi:hypothetical protein
MQPEIIASAATYNEGRTSHHLAPAIGLETAAHGLHAVHNVTQVCRRQLGGTSGKGCFHAREIQPDPEANHH